MQRHTPGYVRSGLTLIALAALAGCSSIPEAPAPAPGKRLAQAAATAPAPQDETITQNVRSQIAREVPLAAIDVHTEQGKVELRGTVEDSEAARKAVKGALATEGVRGVVNELDVEPDASTRTSIAAASTY